MKILLTLMLCLLATSVNADMNARLQQKASDFFKNPSAKRNLIKLLNTHPTYSESDDETPDYPSFDLEGEFGVLVTTGNTNTSMFKLALDADQELESWSNQYFVQFLQRNTEVDDDNIADLDTSRSQISTQFDYKLLNPKYRLFGFAEYDDNQFLQLRHQLTAVAGWSHLAWKREHTEFRYSFGPGWTRSEQEDTGFVLQEMIVRATANYAYRFENNARFRQSITAEMGEVNSKAKSLTSISAKIFERLAMKFSFEMSLDENVSRNVDNFTTQTSISMVYQFF
ncbi:YdiY family protein [Glaciecola siphonariae]|uniref:YdiY family protein n=1 Tax=Glaciecola siphonariae TaxID=521012 RepID=A0ABV9LX96_9ALTE